MLGRRNLALLLIALCSIALLPAVKPAREILDPLEPIAPMASADLSPQDDASMQAVREQAIAALRALRTAAVTQGEP